MNPIPINLAVEDFLSEAVVKKLLRDSGKNFIVGTVYNRGGYGYLKRTAQGWNNAAKGVPFFLLTDLDNADCPASLISSWVSQPIHPNFLFRVAVREVEAWLLADRINLSGFLRISQAALPSSSEQLIDPKNTLVQLASRSPVSSLRNRLVPRTGSTAKQGRDYNSCLGEFVDQNWSPSEAAVGSHSLSRCIAKLRSFSPAWG